MSKKGKVLVAMSGGVDSSVTAMLLHEQGYDLVGITMKTWDYSSSGVNKKETGCCDLDSINDARTLAVKLGFPHYIIDIRDEFGNFIVDNFIGEYMAGRTPNPCVLCNTHIKWDALIKRADMMGCEFIATGHYANVREENNRFIISRGHDKNKDQSYVLWGLKQDVLKRTMLPLGNFTKQQIRQMAADRGYDDIAQKKESYEICFVPDNDYRSFLKHQKPEIIDLEGGDFVDKEGNVLGKHLGYPFYTIGQRKGLTIALGRPVYVVEINPKTNTVVLGDLEDLEEHKMLVKNINLIKYDYLAPEMGDVLTKVRYKDSGTMSTIKKNGNDLEVSFYKKVNAIAPGQSAVFYEGDDLLGGGFIERKL